MPRSPVPRATRGGHDGAGRDLAPLGQHTERPHPGIGADVRAATDAGLDDRAFAHGRLYQPGVRPDLGVRADPTATLQHDSGQEHDVTLELDIDIDIGGLGIPHGHAVTHPPLVDAIAQLGFGHGQLGSVVDPGHLHRVPHDQRGNPVASLVEHLDDVREVVLALDVGRAQTSQGGREHAAPEAVDRGVDLVDGALLVGGVDVLDHPGHGVVPSSDHSSVARRITQDGSEQRGGGVRRPVLVDQLGQGGSPQEGGIPGKDDHVGVVVIIGRQAGESNGHGVTGAALLRLLDELDGHAGRGVLDQRLRHPVGPVADDDHHP